MIYVAFLMLGYTIRWLIEPSRVTYDQGYEDGLLDAQDSEVHHF